MVFSSITFLYVFLPVTLLLYYVMPKKFRNTFIFISGLLFYSWGEPFYVFVMILSTLIDYCAGMVMFRFDSRPAVRRIALIVSVIMNLSLLGVFKYSGFVVENLNAAFGLSLNNPNLPLPIGISFFTFQSMSYTIDLYMRNIKVQKNPLTFAAFVTLFPQIVAGPIVRYEDIAAELDERKLSLEKVYDGIMIFITGLGKKVLIANNIGALWAQVKIADYSEISALTAWLGILAFTFQIYFDFSGYSDMAVGLGKILGFNFPQNFNYPYLSKNISEFWRRWHITLGAWFKSYVYFPLGGSRKGTARTVFNLAVVWFLTGVWHGASWNFIIWGSLYGVVIIIEKLFLGKILAKIPSFLQNVYTLLLVILGWVLFDTADISSALSFMNAMFGGTGTAADGASSYLLINYATVFAICIFACTDAWRVIADALKQRIPAAVNYGGAFIQCLIFLLSTAYLVDATYNPFLYFNF